MGPGSIQDRNLPEEYRKTTIKKLYLHQNEKFSKRARKKFSIYEKTMSKNAVKEEKTLNFHKKEFYDHN